MGNTQVLRLLRLQNAYRTRLLTDLHALLLSLEQRSEAPPEQLLETHASGSENLTELQRCFRQEAKSFGERLGLFVAEPKKRYPAGETPASRTHRSGA